MKNTNSNLEMKLGEIDFEINQMKVQLNSFKEQRVESLKSIQIESKRNTMSKQLLANDFTARKHQIEQLKLSIEDYRNQYDLLVEQTKHYQDQTHSLKQDINYRLSNPYFQFTEPLELNEVEEEIKSSHIRLDDSIALSNSFSFNKSTTRTTRTTKNVKNFAKTFS